MKSDHRHELKTNELADWLANFPQWAEQNRTNLIVTGAVIVVAVLGYAWWTHRHTTVSQRNHETLTRLISDVPRQMDVIVDAASKGNDESYRLTNASDELEAFANGVSDDNLGAMALVKQGDTLRAELHLRQNATREDITAQIGKAQASYQQALDRKPSNVSTAAAAQFGLGLCEEELGNFDKAAEIYRAVVQKAEYTGTVALAAAQHRLKIMDDFKTQLAFKPQPAQPQAAAPTLQIPGLGASNPTIIQAPDEPLIGPEAPPTAPTETPAQPAAETPETPAPTPTTPPAASDANQPAGG